ncbi:hypothetical protein AB0E55_15590 [Amycolatopsis keratiniphila]|uniref:hypothetical protein n=1 Tax=Amycolatopsis keratiniphila TaxID=129921 RepID=UPI0033FB2B10
MKVFSEDQMHGRSDPGREVTESLLRLVDIATSGELLDGVHSYADTMFNVSQLARISAESTGMLARHPELRSDVNRIREFFYSVERRRGYVWISGD